MAASRGAVALRGRRSALLAAANNLHLPFGSSASVSSELPQCLGAHHHHHHNCSCSARSAEDYNGVSTAAIPSDCAVYKHHCKKCAGKKVTEMVASHSRFGFLMRASPAPQHCTSFQRSFSSFSAETADKDSEEPIEQNTKVQSSLPIPQEYGSKEHSSQPSRPLPVNPDNAASYVLMSNIYADGDKWDEVKKINEMRIQARAWKKPGKAYIECKSRVHEFIVGDETHQESAFIYDKIKKMRRHMNNSGYVPNVELVLQNRSNYDPFKPK